MLLRQLTPSIFRYSQQIIPALQGPRARFRFAPLREQILARLHYIAESEKYNFYDDVMDAILESSGGDMRRFLTLLQSYARRQN